MKFAVCLLFQFKVINKGKVNKKRICEEKIYHIISNSANEAYKKALSIGKDEEFNFKEKQKNIFYEFVGIIEMIELVELDEKNVVWSRFVEKLLPLERKAKIIPPKNKLSVFKVNKYKIKL